MVDRRSAKKVPAGRSRSWRRILLWIAAVGFTYWSGKLAVDLIKWAVLLYWAPTGEAKMIMVGYVASAIVPVLLFGIPAYWSWRRLFRGTERGDVGLVLAMELIFLAYVGLGDLQHGLASFVR